MFTTKNITVWRKAASTSNWGDATYSIVGTIVGRVQPVSLTDSIQNNQQNKVVKDLIICDDVYANIMANDELDIGGVHRYVFGVEVYDQGVLPHLEIYSADSQWVRT